MKLYNTTNGILLQHNDKTIIIEEPWDLLINRDNLEAYLLSIFNRTRKISADEQLDWFDDDAILPPIGRQEVWAAGVTYLRSRDARMEESESAASLYDLVYAAERPELFFKATPQRVAGHKQPVYIRKDSDWNVPEPELTLFISSTGNIKAILLVTI